MVIYFLFFLSKNGQDLVVLSLPPYICTVRILPHFSALVFSGGQAYKLIMEYVPLGSLKEYLPRHKKGTSLNTLLNYSMQICKVRDPLTSVLSFLPERNTNVVH